MRHHPASKPLFLGALAATALLNACAGTPGGSSSSSSSSSGGDVSSSAGATSSVSTGGSSLGATSGNASSTAATSGNASSAAATSGAATSGAATSGAATSGVASSGAATSGVSGTASSGTGTTSGVSGTASSGASATSGDSAGGSSGMGNSSSAVAINCPNNLDPATALDLPLGTATRARACAVTDGTYAYWKVSSTFAAGDRVAMSAVFVNGVDAQDVDFELGTFDTDNLFTAVALCNAGPSSPENCGGTLEAATLELWVKADAYRLDTGTAEDFDLTVVNRGANTVMCTINNTQPGVAVALVNAMPLPGAACYVDDTTLYYWKLDGMFHAMDAVELKVAFASGQYAADVDFQVITLDALGDSTTITSCYARAGVDELCEDVLPADATQLLVVADPLDPLHAEDFDITLTVTPQP